jgi:transcriptional regulator of heat shock response
VEIEKAIGQERIEQAKKQKELEDKNKQLETDNQTKDQQIKEKEEAIGKKITKELIEKLTNLEPGKIDETKINEIKTLLEEVKKQEVKADLTNTDKKIEEVGKKLEETKSPSSH